MEVEKKRYPDAPATMQLIRVFSIRQGLEREDRNYLNSVEEIEPYEIRFVIFYRGFVTS
jgi:hypothetical protein